jgi:hypothetical protein
MTSATVFVGAIVRPRVAACVVTAIVLGARVQAQETDARIAGIGADLAGAPVAAALIALHGPAEREVRAGEDGRFVLEFIPDGTYTITATQEGFAPSSYSVKVVSGETAPITLILRHEFLEQVTITADKTGERKLASVPLAVTVLSPEHLEQLQAHTVAHLAGLAPSVTFAQNVDFAQLTIRGIGSNAVFTGSDPSSAVYLDGVYLARPVVGRCFRA